MATPASGVSRPIDKLKGPLDWVQRWVALWQGLVGLGLGKLVSVVLAHLTTISKDWLSPIGLIVAAAVWVLLIYLTKRKSSTLQEPAPQTGVQIVVQGVGLETNINAVNEFHKKHSGQYLEEIERHFERLAAHFTAPTERERFLIRAISGGALAIFHDETWRSIYRSQIELLQDLNTNAMTLEQVKPYYDAAAAANPDRYKDYTFEQWLAYLRGQLVILQDANVVQLTVRGKDFLRFLLQDGKSAKQRFN